MLNMQYFMLPYCALPPSDKFLSRKGTKLRISVTSAASALVATGFYALRGSAAPLAWPRPLSIALHGDWTDTAFFPLHGSFKSCQTSRHVLINA